MKPLARDDLMSLEHYAEARPDFRTRVLAHKRNRKVAIGANATVLFEDRLTVQYQVQEMLRVERIFERAGIEEELAAYNPLIPDGANLKATFMLEYEDVEERRAALAQLHGVERAVWIRVGDHPPVFAIADEDLDRETQEKTSSVHFLRFELTPGMCADAKSGSPMAMGIEHQRYGVTVDPLPDAVRASLAADLE